MTLHHTYELYLDDGSGRPVFEPLTCAENNLMGELKALIEGRGLKSIEVRQRGETLFIVE